MKHFQFPLPGVNTPSVPLHFEHDFILRLCFTPLPWSLLSSTPVNEVFHRILRRGCKAVGPGGPGSISLRLFQALVNHYNGGKPEGAHENCGQCSSCKDMPKFGGPGCKKQCCELRKCLVTDVNLSKGHVCANGLCNFHHSKMQCCLRKKAMGKIGSIYIHQEQVSLLKHKWVLVA